MGQGTHIQSSNPYPNSSPLSKVWLVGYGLGTQAYVGKNPHSDKAGQRAKAWLAGYVLGYKDRAAS
jgi:hypothetical protein